MKYSAIAAMLVGGLWGMDAQAQFTGQHLTEIFLQEIYQHPHKIDCALYKNRLTPMGQEDAEEWETPVGTVGFVFDRGAGNIPDIVKVASVPEGYIVVPYTVKREEGETAEFCITKFEGV